MDQLALVQVLYAANERWWTNEKQALAGATTLALCPPGFVADVTRVLACPGRTADELGVSVETLHVLTGVVRALVAPLLRA